MLKESQMIQGSDNLDNDREKLEKEIREKLHLYHQTSKEKWQQIQKIGAILSERELLNRGLITKEQLNDFETTSTGELDREAGRDNYVFASHKPAGYGEVTLEIDLSVLDLPETKVSTAGEYLMHAVDEDDQNYYQNSLISGTEFIKYLINFLPTLPNKEWFWNNCQEDLELAKFIGEAHLDKYQKGDKIKFRQYWKLFPEIMFAQELPLKYIKRVIIDGVEQPIKNYNADN